MKWGGIVVAAGRGTRFGRPKQFVEIDGLPMVGWSIRALASVVEIEEIVVVTERDWLSTMEGLVARVAPACSIRVVVGGATRQASVRNGLRALSPASDAVLVHDGARPLVLPSDICMGIREVRSGRGAVLAAAVVDTIKVVDAESMRVVETPDRGRLWAAQTPQFAMRADLERAHDDADAAGVTLTDDVALLERIGLDVIVVPSSSENFKVTHAPDVRRAEAVLRERLAMEERA